MIITISGDPGSGKSTVAKLIAKKLGYKHYSGGDMRGLIAQERGITIDELNKIGETDPSTDKAVDDKIVALGKTQDNFVIDSRVAWHFIPASYKVYLTTDPAVAARRIYDDVHSNNKDRADEPRYASVKSVLEHLKARIASDKKRYKKYYGINHTDPHNYDVTIDTTEMPVEKVVNFILTTCKSFK